MSAVNIAETMRGRIFGDSVLSVLGCGDIVQEPPSAVVISATFRVGAGKMLAAQEEVGNAICLVSEGCSLNFT